MEWLQGGDGLSAGGDTVFQESDGVGLTASVPSSRAGRTPGRRCIVPDRSIQQKKKSQLVRFRSTEASIPSSDRSSDVME